MSRFSLLGRLGQIFASILVLSPSDCALVIDYMGTSSSSGDSSILVLDKRDIEVACLIFYAGLVEKLKVKL